MNHEHTFQDSEVIDLPSVLERLGGDETFLQELLTIYVEEFTSRVANLERAIVNQDFSSIQEIAHSLKGSSANLSLLELQRISLVLEIAGREKDMEKIKQNLTSLKGAFAKLQEYLKSPR